MLPLAFNPVVPQFLKWKPRFAIAALPIGLMFASFGPLFFFAYSLERALGIPHNSPIRNHPNGILWIALFLGTMVILMVLGYLLGWLANALISHYVLAWPASKVVAVYMRSEVPLEWLKPSATQTTNPGKQESALQKWESQRSVGLLRFILFRGVLAWGGAMFLAMYLLPATLRGSRLDFATVLVQALLWTGAGAAFGAIAWFVLGMEPSEV